MEEGRGVSKLWRRGSGRGGGCKDGPVGGREGSEC